MNVNKLLPRGRTEDKTEEVNRAAITLSQYAVALWIITTFATFRRRSVNELLISNTMDFQVIYQSTSWCLLFAFALYLRVSRRFDASLVRRGPLFWYGAFLGLATCSIFYTRTPIITMYYVMQLSTLIIMICSLGNNLHAIHGYVTFYACINWILLILGALGLDLGQSWITTAQESYERYGGSSGELWRFSTAFGHPSQLSIVCAISAVGLAARREQWKFKKLLIAMLTFTVILTLSRTAIVGMIAGFAFVLFVRRKLLSVVIVSLITVPFVLVLPAATDQLQNLFMRGQSASDFASLTGRSAIYDVALARANWSWFGEGFRSIRSNPLIGLDWGQGVLHAHNLILNAFIELGFFGACALLMTAVSLYTCGAKLASRSRQTNSVSETRDYETLAMTFPVAAYCILDSGFALNADIFIVVFIMLCAQARYKLSTQSDKQA